MGGYVDRGVMQLPPGEEWRSCLLGLERIFEHFPAGPKGSFIMQKKSPAFEAAQLDCCDGKEKKSLILGLDKSFRVLPRSPDAAPPYSDGTFL